MKRALPALLALSCAPPADRAWWTQLEADSPCYRVDLLDGLDEVTTAELHDLYGCLDHHGHLAPLWTIDEGFELPTRGRSVGLELAGLVNALPEADVDPFALGGLAVELLQREDRALDAWIDVGLELGWGQPAVALRGRNVAVGDAEALRGGVLVPLAPVIPEVARALLGPSEAADGALDLAADLVQSAETRRWIRTLDGWARTPDPLVRAELDPLIGDVGRLALATRSPQNDRWSGASGDSLRDLSDAFLASGAAHAVAPEAEAIFGDPVVRSELEQILVQLHAEGRLERVVPQMRWLATVNAAGQPLIPGEDSALASFVRLLARANAPMTCSLDLWVTDVEIELGNLGQSVLGLMADLDPETVQTSTGLIADLLGFGVTEFLVVEIAESGVCDPLDAAMIDDLRAVEAMQGPEAEDFLRAFVGLLAVLKYGEQDRVPALVDLATELHALALVEPVEEVLRDVGDQSAVARLARLVPALAEPSAHGITAGPDSPVDLDEVLAASVWLFASDAEGRTGWARVEPLAAPALAHDGTWSAIGSLARVAADPASRTSRAWTLVPPLLAVDPELAALDALGPLLRDRRLSTPLLTIAESGPFVGRLLAAEPVDGQDRVPLAFVGELVVDGTLDELLRTIDVVLDAL